MLFVPRLENIDREESVVIELSGMSGTKWALNGDEPHEWDHWHERYQTGTKRHQPHEWNQRDERYQKGTKWAPTSTRRAILVLGARAGKYRS